MKILMTGNEAVARGAFEAGISFASAYPGTPSTEILENIAGYKEEITAEWAANEKVALETAIGASIAGARSLAAMKHVGVNVAADPLFTFAYMGVNAGLVLVSADDPGLHSSQDEQDNRYYAKFAKVAMLEPSDSQEAKDMVVAAMEIGERFDTAVLLRMTTRLCHSKTPVSEGPVGPRPKKPYVKRLDKFDSVPATARKLHVELEKRLVALEAFSNETELNRVEWNGSAVGVVSSGVAYQYAKEVFGKTASFFKLGFTHPLPMRKLKEFASRVEKLYVVEELELYIEEQLKAAGIACTGKELIPRIGELNPAIVAKALLGKAAATIEVDKTTVAERPPVLCAGCPHRGFFVELGKIKGIMIAGDIGCYGLGGMDPLNAKDAGLCMGASISMAQGAQKAFERFGEKTRAVAVIGDSTFFHTGMNSLLSSVYNRAATVTCILDNRITAMTGHQDNPGTGYTLQGAPTKEVDIEKLVRALGVEKARTVNPLDLGQVRESLAWALAQDEPTVIVARWPCALKKRSEAEKKEFGAEFGLCAVDPEKCIGCKACLRTGCPALRYDAKAKKTRIDAGQCVGCEVCAQVCPKKAIALVGASHV
jgi:indolepyruvate ferredoxin oxidoreductase alpha subunit